MKQALAIARKELDGYFGSPMALIFVGVFLAITHFTFFWATGFFARGIADVRPLFQWMPILLIFLIAALTMRQWSEEQQTGTLEILLTLPVKIWQLVVGKFLAVLALVVVALLLTLSLPFTVAVLGNIDLGPVIGGYLAALLLASAYAAIGLFVSAQTDNQIVALIVTAILGGLFYLIGSQAITGLVSTSIGEVLRALGTGSRFESIERGVIDLRDLVYYGSLTLLFLVLNVVSLDSKRWSMGGRTRGYRLNRRLMSGLVALNLIAFNVWVFRVDNVRVDLTQSGEYSLSPVTRELVSNMQEPLLVRGYFSQKMHPLLAPLVPRVRDMLQEYAIASRGKMTLEFVDPITNPEVETEANQTYGIRPTPLQSNDRGGTELINAYTHILIRYGDQNQVLNLLDMLQINQSAAGVDIQLRNLEYDLTSTIQRTVYGFQSIESVLSRLDQPARMTVFVTPNTLPESLRPAPELITRIATSIRDRSGGKFEFSTVDLSAPNPPVSPQTLQEQYQIQPIGVGLFSTDTFYLHTLIQVGDQYQVVYPSGEFSEAEIRSAIESALKRLAPGFLQVVGVWTPPDLSQFTGSQSLQQYTQVLSALRQSYEIRTVDLSSGQVAADINALVIIAPQGMTDVDRYAIDQYLMRGGSVFVAAASYLIGADQATGGLALNPVTGGLQEMLASYGVNVEQKLVLDTQNVPFPATVRRNVGGMIVQEIQAIDYPQFIDVRQNAMDRDNPVTAGLAAVTINWGSPVNVSEAEGRTVSRLLRSSGNAWTTTDTSTEPNPDLYPETGFPVSEERGEFTLATAITGRFTSFFKGKPSPFAPQSTAVPGQSGPVSPTPTAVPGQPAAPVSGFIDQSPSTARLIVIGSAEFLNDNILGLMQRMGDNRSANSIQFVQNSVDWFVQDTALASIRARGSTSRLLRPLGDGEQSRWEAFNYLFALIALVGLGLVWQARRRSEKPIPLAGEQPTQPASSAPPDGEPEQPATTPEEQGEETDETQQN